MKRYLLMLMLFSALVKSQLPSVHYGILSPYLGLGQNGLVQARIAFDSSSTDVIFTGTSFNSFPMDGYTYNISPSTTAGLVIKYDYYTKTRKWGFVIKGGNNGYVNYATCDNNNNVYVCGKFNTTFDFDPGPGTATVTSLGTFDAYVAKYDANGNFVWVRTFGVAGSGYSGDVIRYANGSIYLSGTFQNSCDFDPGAGVNVLTSNGGDDVYVLQLDPAGNHINAVSFGGSGAEIVKAGYHDKTGCILLTGSFNSSVDFDPGAGSTVLTSAGNTDAYYLKLTPSCNFKWAVNIGNVNKDEGTAIVTDDSLNVFAAATVSATTIDLDPGLGADTKTCVGLEDMAVIKLDSLGNYKKGFLIGSFRKDYPTYLTFDKWYNLYLFGNYQNTIDADPGPGVASFTPAVGSGSFYYDNMLIARYTRNLSYQTAFNVSSNGSWNAAVSMGLCKDSTFMIAGGINGNADFQPGPSTVVYGSCSASCLGNQACYVKYGNCISPSTVSISGATTICSGSSLVYTASPGSSSVNYNWALPSGWTGASTGSTISAVSPTNTGVFTLTVQPQNSCNVAASATLQVTIATCTDIKQIGSENTIRIFPNPFSEKITFEGTSQITDVVFYDLLGKVVWQGKFSSQRCVFNDLPLVSGIYFCSIRDILGINYLIKLVRQ